MYLLDTNVVSELRRASCDANVRAWVDAQLPTSLFLSAITLLELEIGVLRVERKDQAQGERLRDWLQHNVRPAFAGRILPFDESVAMRCAQLHVPDPKSERDASIAATAIVHGMSVVTRNLNNFQGTGVPLVDPWRAR
ncbi:MAG: type II toxin-antitoxin system VapC family toxin [Lysobacter sp.]|nr:type II toxin-antitoxin system VapC family toxin [Lysobacter sp.]